MAEVTTVEYVTPQVKNVTLKLQRSEANDLKLFIIDWYDKNYSYSPQKYKQNATYQALETALAGKVSSDKVVF